MPYPGKNWKPLGSQGIYWIMPDYTGLSSKKHKPTQDIAEDQQIYHQPLYIKPKSTIISVTAEDVQGSKTATGSDELERTRIAAGWRIRVDGFWGAGPDEVFLFADYKLGRVAIVRTRDWAGSETAECVQQLDAECESCDPASELRPELIQTRRTRAACLVKRPLSSGRITIPREIIWVLQLENETARDLMLVLVEPVLEVWSTKRWQRQVGGSLFVAT